MSRAWLLLATVLVLPVLTAGCTDSQGLPRLDVSIQDDTVKWGHAAQLTIRNLGEGPAPAPITLEVRSTDGSVVRTYEDITRGRGIPVNGQITVAWNGTNDAGRPVLWGNYTLTVAGYEKRATVELLKPPTYAMTIDAIPREAPAGDTMEFRVNNTGNTWINGTLTVAAGRDDTILYSNEVDVELAAGQGYSFFWNGKTPDGEQPEPDKYLIAGRVEPDDGPKPFAQDVFTLTEPEPG